MKEDRTLRPNVNVEGSARNLDGMYLEVEESCNNKISYRVSHSSLDGCLQRICLRGGYSVG